MPAAAASRPTQKRGAVGRPSKRKQRPNATASLAIDYADELDQGCAQAIAIASLVMEADAEPAIQDSGWAIRDLIERVKALGESLFQLTRPSA